MGMESYLASAQSQVWIENFIGNNLSLILVMAVAIVILKGFSLWYSAKNNQKGWFIALLIINSLGLLPLVYLLFFKDKK